MLNMQYNLACVSCNGQPAVIISNGKKKKNV